MRKHQKAETESPVRTNKPPARKFIPTTHKNRYKEEEEKEDTEEHKEEEEEKSQPSVERLRHRASGIPASMEA